MVFNIFSYSKEIELLRYFFKYLLYPLILFKAFRFVVNFKEFFLSTYRDISPSLKGKEP